MKSRELNFWDYLAVLVKWRKLIVLNFVAVCLIAVALSLVLPKWYKAKATLLPPEESSNTSAIASLLTDLPLGGLTIPGTTTSTDLFVAILGSRTVAEGVIQKLDLMEVYKSKNLEGAVETLQKHSSFGITKEGVLTIEVEEKDPHLAAKVANAFVVELDRVNQETNVSQAKSKRLFVERRLKESQLELEKAEEELKLFQEKNKAISLPVQISTAIERAAELKAEQVSLEIQLGVLLKTASRSHPQVEHLRSQISEIQKQLEKIEFGNVPNLSSQKPGSSERTEFHVPFSKVPTVGLELARLTRNLKIQEAVYGLLTQQYEQAKIEEAKDTPTVQILDVALPPIRKSKPNRKMFVIFLGFLSLFLSMVCAFSVEYFQRLRVTQAEEYDRVSGLFHILKGDIKHLRSKGKRRM
ncbi:MAG: hypothetical protein AMJ92_12275 [candidate division Zixibacteria bacterium SM23_81]|nr:MAG: hypothetical protein AMJ92_12275 [candidate division Zixibacteria bacterium SM23_81]